MSNRPPKISNAQVNADASADEESSATVTEVAETPQQLPPDIPFPEPVPVAGVYPTDFYKAAGIPFCSECGDKRRTRSDGSAICSISSTQCPYAVHE